MGTNHFKNCSNDMESHIQYADTLGQNIKCKWEKIHDLFTELSIPIFGDLNVYV